MTSASRAEELRNLSHIVHEDFQIEYLTTKLPADLQRTLLEDLDLHRERANNSTVNNTFYNVQAVDRFFSIARILINRADTEINSAVLLEVQWLANTETAKKPTEPTLVRNSYSGHQAKQLLSGSLVL